MSEGGPTQSTTFPSVARQLLLHPATFFLEHPAPSDYRTQLMLPLPAIAVFSVLSACVGLKPLLLFSGFLAAYALIGIWMLSLRYCLLMFGENRSFQEVLHISTCAAFAFLFGWLPVVGGPLCALYAAFLTWTGLVYTFKMNPGAALAAVSVPVVIGGFAGGILTYVLFLLLGLGSLMRGGA